MSFLQTYENNSLLVKVTKIIICLKNFGKMGVEGALSLTFSKNDFAQFFDDPLTHENIKFLTVGSRKLLEKDYNRNIFGNFFPYTCA